MRSGMIYSRASQGETRRKHALNTIRLHLNLINWLGVCMAYHLAENVHEVANSCAGWRI